MPDFSYKTIAKATTAQYTDKNSRFLGYAFPVNSETEVKGFLDVVRNEHPKASHYCFAFKIGTDGNLFRANDDGEPSGSAGRPILGQIESFDITNTFIVVVRYYGGVNLGVSGLIKAYKTTAQLSLETAKIITKFIQREYSIEVEYARVNEFQEWVNQQNIQIIDEEYSNTSARYRLRFARNKEKEYLKYLGQFMND